MPSKPPTGYSTTRRTFLKSSALSILGAPAILSTSARASSGQLNLLAWEHTLPESLLKAFRDATGIEVKLLPVGSNEEIINKMKTTHGDGIDLINPTNTRAAQWAPLQLLQAFDLSNLKQLDKLRPAMLEAGTRDWNFNGGGPHWLPHTWGSEAIAWRTDMWQPQQASPSYGDLWNPDIRGQVMMQPHSGMLAAGLYLEAMGKLPRGAMLEAYSDENKMRTSWQQVTAFCMKNKAQIKLFWNDAQSQVNALLNEGVVAGQSWDGPVLALKTEGEPVAYRAPVEGALTWIDGFALSAKASNVPQAYAFLDFCFDAQIAGQGIDAHGYNSAVLGAEQYANDAYRSNFSDAYAGEALDNLWIWPSEPEWYAEARKQYRNQFVNA